MRNIANILKRRNIVLEITYECNLMCNFCSRWCKLAPVKNDSSRMSVEQIQYFVNEMKIYHHHTSIIKVSGGEPLLHPDIWQILDILKVLLDDGHCIQILLLTNGILEEKIKDIPSWVSVVNSEKNRLPFIHSIKYGMPPIELNKIVNAENNECEQIFDGPYCSICLNKWGYYLAGPCGALDRFIGIDIGVKTLKEIIETDFKVLEDQQDKLCKFCGFSHASKNTDHTQSHFYRQMIYQYYKNECKLTDYGEKNEYRT